MPWGLIGRPAVEQRRIEKQLDGILAAMRRDRVCRQRCNALDDGLCLPGVDALRRQRFETPPTKVERLINTGFVEPHQATRKVELLREAHRFPVDDLPEQPPGGAVSP